MNILPVSPQKKTHKRTKFYVLLSLLLSCCFVEYVFGMYIPQAILLGIAFAAAMTGDADENAALCMCCVPLHTFFEYAFVILFSIICLVIKNRSKIRITGSIIPVFLMILWELLHSFTPDLKIMQFGSHCTTWLLLAVMMCTSEHKFDYAFIVRAFVLSLMVICCALLGKLMYTSGVNLASLLVNMQRLGVEADTGMSKINPNTLGILCIFGVCGLLQLRRMNCRRREDVGCILVLLLFGIMTASRTFLVCLLFMVGLFFISSKGDVSEKAKYAFSILASGILVLAVSYIIMPDLLRYYISRFFESDISSGRVDTMGEYHRYLIENLDVLFSGIGLQSFSERIIALCPQAIFVPHNGLQELLLAWGIVGVGLFVALWSAMIVHSRRCCTKQSLINYIPFLILLLKTLAGQMLNSAYTMLMFSFTYLSMCTDFTTDMQTRPVLNQESTAPLTSVGELTLQQTVKKLWKKKTVLVALGLIGFVIAYGVTKYFVTPMYESKVLLYVNNRNISEAQVADIISNNDLIASRKLVNTYREILLARSTLDEVIVHSGYQGSYEALRGMITARAANGTEILEIVVTGTDPSEAATIANAIADILPQQITAIMDGTSVQVIDYAVSASKPCSPSKAINAFVGGVIGCVLGIMLVLLQAMRDTRITEETLTTQHAYPVLAVIPGFQDKKGIAVHRKRSKCE